MEITLSSLEKILQEVFKDKDAWLARMLKDGLDHHKPESGCMPALAWASGNIGNKLPKTGEALFDFVDKFENESLLEQLRTEKEHSRFVEGLLREVCGKDWDQLTMAEAKNLRTIKTNCPECGAMNAITCDHSANCPGARKRSGTCR